MTGQDSRKLSEILKEAASGKETDQAEVTASVSKLMLVFLPVITFVLALIVPSALSLYLLASSTVGYFQTKRVLGQDVEEMNQIANEPDSKPSRKKVTATAKKVEKIPKKTASNENVTKDGIKTTITISTAGGKPVRPNASRAPTKSNKKKRKRR